MPAGKVWGRPVAKAGIQVLLYGPGFCRVTALGNYLYVPFNLHTHQEIFDASAKPRQ
jgi:hypothetical protein